VQPCLVQILCSRQRLRAQTASHRCDLNHATAMQSISTRTSLGSLEHSTAARAGLCSPKVETNAAFRAAKLSIDLRNTWVGEISLVCPELNTLVRKSASHSSCPPPRSVLESPRRGRSNAQQSLLSVHIRKLFDRRWRLRFVIVIAERKLTVVFTTLSKELPLASTIAVRFFNTCFTCSSNPPCTISSDVGLIGMHPETKTKPFALMACW
jgi:hypothetical protein